MWNCLNMFCIAYILISEHLCVYLFIHFSVVSMRSYMNFVMFHESRLFSREEVFCVLQLCLRFKQNYTADAASRNGNLYEMWDAYWSTVYLLQAVMGQIQKKDWWSIFLIQPTTTNWSDQRLMVQNWSQCSWWSHWHSSSVWSVNMFTFCSHIYIQYACK